MESWWVTRKRMSVRMPVIAMIGEDEERGTSVVPAAESADDADAQLSSALNMLHQLTEHKRDAVAAGIRCDAKTSTRKRERVRSPHESILARMPVRREASSNRLSMGFYKASTSAQMLHEDDPALSLYSEHVIDMAETEMDNLESYISELRQLNSNWQRYTTERDTFRTWLLGRLAASRHLIEIRSRSSQPDDEERRSLEDFVRELRGNEPQLKSIQASYYDLTRGLAKGASLDPVLNEVRADFEALVGRMEGRLSRRDQMVTTRPSLYQQPNTAFGTQTMDTHEVSTQMRGPAGIVVKPTNTEADYAGLRNSGGNRGIARTLWPYQASSSWQDDDAFTKEKPSQTRETNLQSKSRDAQQALALKQLIKTVRSIRSELQNSEIASAKRSVLVGFLRNLFLWYNDPRHTGKP
ncbi:hypothetical protein Ciccas_012450 [Cichlidogyrus casuarinus]|uniref:Uncharacterized protein n=1 Tax=Cichlidogyrus casuarinus TaxID=1844966 RepID=A0ABD2PP26_9PLAT